MCPSPEDSMKIYASQGIKRKLRENTTDTFQKFRYIFEDDPVQERFESADLVPEISSASENLVSQSNSSEFNIIDRVRALDSNPKFIDSVVEHPKTVESSKR